VEVDLIAGPVVVEVMVEAVVIIAKHFMIFTVLFSL
jgi:hypothetical protein